jgi:Predicted O-linked N-acetylglucosamine transferase, SPINDLY family
MSSVGELLAASAKARSTGARTEAAALLADALTLHRETREPVPRSSYYELGLLLYELKRYAEAEGWLQTAIERQPKDFATANLLGVVYRRLGQFPDALKWLDRAQKLNPRTVSPQVNKANVYIALGDGPRAQEALRKAIRQEPKVAEHHRMLGVAHRLTGDLDGARQKFQVSLSLDPRNMQAWVDSAGVLQELQRGEESLAALDDAIRVLGEQRLLVESKIKVLRSLGRVEAAEAWSIELIERYPDAGWLHYQLGRSIAPRDRQRANTHFREAVRLSPEASLLTELADSLDRTRGPAEAQNIQEGYEVAKRRLELGGDVISEAKVLHNICYRVADYDAAEQFGGFAAMGKRYIAQNEIAGLHYLLGHARSTEDRLLLVDLHRTWGKRVDARAAKSPIQHAPAIVGRAKIRIGFVSSDLRHHPVSYFTLPLLEGYDRSRFEIYCYSWFTRAEDNVQKHIIRIVDAFRLRPHIGARDAAQLIADDQVDVLFELGGSTDMNKLEVMSWRPSPRQASWLGYPHSAGLETIDRILVDPFLKPASPALLIEKPFELGHSWVTLGRLGFDDREAITPGTPEERKGHLTFGTANACYKYNRELLQTWAEILRRVDGSRFVFLRPEGAVPAFVANIRRHFEDHGVDGERIEFIAVRGTHMRHYNEIDIALDTFPHVGGTTTCESLWMAVPTVTVAGEAFFERMSYSNVNNAGLGDLCALNREGYADIAVALARDGTRRAELRRTMRERLRSHPIGRADVFVADFQEAIVGWMDEQEGS